MAVLKYNEKELFLRIAEGDENAYFELYTCWHKKVYSYIFAISAQQQHAEEGTQEIFINIWQHRHELPQVRNFEAWLFVIVRRHTLNLLRKTANEKNMLHQFKQLLDQEDILDYRNIAEHAEKSRMLQQAILQLPSQQKLVYELSQLEGLTRKEIAVKLDLSPNTVRNHLNAAVISLRTYLQHHYPDALIFLMIQYLFK